MQLTRPLPRQLRRERPPHRAEPPSAERARQARAQRSGGPEDLALYTCACGYTFKAAVTTSVDCPHCGAAQAW